MMWFVAKINHIGDNDIAAPSDTEGVLRNDVAGPNDTQAINIHSITPPSVQLDELKEITHNFGTQAFICEGTYGRLYNGILNSGKASCIKKLDSDKFTYQEFLAHVGLKPIVFA